MKDLLIKFWKDEEGATAIEYGLIAGLIAAVIVGAVALLGDQLNALLGNITGELEEASGVSAPDS